MENNIKHFYGIIFELDEDENKYRYHSQIKFNDEISYIDLGFYDDPNEAAFVYNVAKKYLFKDSNNILTYNTVPQYSISQRRIKELEDTLNTINSRLEWINMWRNTIIKCI